MKKLSILFLLIVSSIFSFSQEHLAFKGIPIDGTLTEFVTKLQEVGYALTYTNDEGYASILEGNFAGFSGCKIIVVASQYSHIVWKVSVKLPEQTSWYALKSRFNDYKTSLIQKYGEPEGDYHFFSKPYYEGDGYEFQALRNDKCSYVTFFSTPEGHIAIEIESKEYNSGRVSITYEDIINTQLRKNDQQKSVSNDL